MNYGRTNRSIHYLHQMKKGQVVKKEDIAVLRTEKVLSPGVSPEFLNLVIGKRLVKDVEDGDGLNLSDFM